MKKLLVILLLFPVHGAWAEKINISCELYLDGTSLGAPWIYEIDTSKEVVNGEQRIAVIDDYKIQWNTTADMKTKKNHWVIKHHDLNRQSGELTLTLSLEIPALEAHGYMVKNYIPSELILAKQEVHVKKLLVKRNSNPVSRTTVL